MKLGVFDSGIGGEAIAASLQQAFPDAEILTADDYAHLPYGSRPIEDIARLTDDAIQPLLRAECDVIVIACNSATAAAIEQLRDSYPNQLFIGLEPMVKPATAMTKTGVIAVCATPATLASPRYHKLRETYAQKAIVLEPDCRSWASMIEHDQIDELIIQNIVRDVVQQGADVIVLACTHYHWIRETIDSLAGDSVIILEPTDAIIRQVKNLLNQRG